MFVAAGESQRPGRHLDQVARDVGGPGSQLLLAAIDFVEQDVIEHVLGDRAGTAEDVERHARCRAVGNRAERALDMRDVVGTADVLGRAVIAGHVVDVPEELAVTGGEIAVQAGREIARVDILGEDARAAFERAPGDERAFRADRAERVVRIARVDADEVGEATAAGFGTEEDRFGCGLVDRVTLGVGALDAPVHVIGDAIGALAEERGTPRRRQQQVVRRIVEALGIGPGSEAARAVTRQVAERGAAIDRAQSAKGFGRIGRCEDLATVRRRRAPGIGIHRAADAGRRIA